MLFMSCYSVISFDVVSDIIPNQTKTVNTKDTKQNPQSDKSDNLQNVMQQHKDSQWQNYNIEYFGENLFNGHFAKNEVSFDSPDYKLNINDEIEVSFWGAFEFNQKLKVDKQGNIFIPKVGNVKVAGVKNKNLNEHIKKISSKTFQKNVEVYANIVNYNKIRVFVTGFVNKPGIYSGNPFSSVLPYLDQANGIHTEKGSFVDIQVLRGNEVLQTINLYSFLIHGTIPNIQLQDGDVINVKAKKSVINLTGDILNQGKFEITQNNTGEQFIEYANPKPTVNYVIITRNKNTQVENLKYSIQAFKTVKIQPEDRISFVSTLKDKTIRVILKGEYDGDSILILPKDSVLRDVLSKVTLNNLSVKEDIFLYRKSAAKLQKEWLNKTLDQYERELLNYAPQSVEDAKIRGQEIEILTKYIQQARNAPGNGMIVLYDAKGKPVNTNSIHLEDEDIIFIPKRNDFIGVFGQVFYPSFLPYKSSMKAQHYIDASGGISSGGSKETIFVKHRNGSIEKISFKTKIRAGDEIFVMPYLQFKTLQFTKDMTDVIFRSALLGRFLLF